MLLMNFTHDLIFYNTVMTVETVTKIYQLVKYQSSVLLLDFFSKSGLQSNTQ